MIKSARANCERIYVLMKIIFCSYTLCIARKTDKIRAKIVRKAPQAIYSACSIRNTPVSPSNSGRRTSTSSLREVNVRAFIVSVRGFLKSVRGNVMEFLKSVSGSDRRIVRAFSVRLRVQHS